VGPAILQQLLPVFRSHFPQHVDVALKKAMQALEVMVCEGWVRAELDPTRPRLHLESPREGEFIHHHHPDRGEAPTT